VTGNSDPLEALIGAEAVVEATVEPDSTAAAVGSGDVDVLSTPAVLALVEWAAVRAIGTRLSAGQTSVGTAVDLAHIAPSGVGATVRALARLERVSDRRLEFTFSVTDGSGEVARGRHVRVVVDRKRFESAAAKRRGVSDPG
jgi:fluoroacetyl-CoA thioesterase